MLNDKKILEAVSKIEQRSERQEDRNILLGTYVDVGILPQLNNNNHQIFYGRRGTGKTHVMRVLETRLKERKNNIVVYIDCRTLGSSSQFSDECVPIPKRCLALFRDLLIFTQKSLLEHIVENSNNTALSELDELSNIITKPIKTFVQEQVRMSEQGSTAEKKQVGATFSATNVDIDAKKNIVHSQTKENEVTYSVSSDDKIVFSDLINSLSKILELTNSRLFILLDEWSSLPLDIQPYLAEFLKRGILPITKVTVKISALEHRCRFSITSGAVYKGFELGADISAAQDIDDYFVFDRNEEGITDTYADVLLRHISIELPNNYLLEQHSIDSSSELASRLFSERKTCAELARAAEGVIRDLINIFTKAVFRAKQKGYSKIDKRSINEAAKQWYEQDKSKDLDPQLNAVLRRIIDEVIGKKKARSFLLLKELEKHSVIQRLFDARVLHSVSKGYADKDNPGVRYNVYAIDYGAYVDLIGTSREPKKMFVDDSNSDDDSSIVPFDDKRSIRRIILNREVLEDPAV